MSVSSEVERIKTNISNAYTELENKGATIPSEKNSNNLASTISDMPTGGDMSEYYSSDIISGSAGATDGTKNTPGILNSITKLPNFEVSPTTTNLAYAFSNLPNLLEAPMLDTTNITNMTRMFAQDTSLISIPKYNTSNLTTITGMFQNCSTLKSIPDFDFQKVTSFQNMCNGCSSLESFPKIKNSIFTTCNTMLRGCSNLVNLDLSEMDASKCTNIAGMFQNCSSLENLTFMSNVGKAYTQKSTNYSNYTIDVSGCTKLTHDSLMNIINNIYDLNVTYNVANGNTLYTQRLNVGYTNNNKLTADEILIATNKGWSVTW